MANPEPFFSGRARKKKEKKLLRKKDSLKDPPKWIKDMRKTINACNNYLHYTTDLQKNTRL